MQGGIITNVCSVGRPSTMCARKVTERLRRLHDRVTGGLHPCLVMLVGVCLCVVWCVLSRRASRGGWARKRNDRNNTRLSCFAHFTCLVLSCFFRVHPWRAFSGACRSRPTLYRAEHHTPMGRVLRSYALEPSRGLCGSDTCMPVLDHIKFQYVPISLLSPFSLNMPQNPSNTTPIE